MMTRLHNLEENTSNQGLRPKDATNAVTEPHAHKGLVLGVNGVVLKFLILSLTYVFKISEPVEHVLMAWRLGPQEGPSQLPSLTQALNHPPSHSLLPQDMPSLPFLPLPTRRSKVELMCSTPSWDRMCTPRWHPGLAVPQCVRQVTLGGGVSLSPTPDPGTVYIGVQRSRSLGGHLWEGEIDFPAP